jgi:hypothetical protein
MIRVYRSESLADVGHWRNILELRGIGCHIRNLYASSITGELPWLESLPELWVLDDRDAPLADRLIRQGRSDPAPGSPPWSCGECGERIDPQFTACWKCGRERAQA